MQRAALMAVVPLIALARPAHAACPEGGVPEPEICDCIDNDCDGRVDEDSDPLDGSITPLCPGLQACMATAAGCRCLEPCRNGGFPCAAGRQCIQAPLSSRPGDIRSVCIDSACRPDVDPCDAGFRCTAKDGVNAHCEATCVVTGCEAGKECVNRYCVETHRPPSPDGSATNGGAGGTTDAALRPAHDEARGRGVSGGGSSCACQLPRRDPRDAQGGPAALVFAMLYARRRHSTP